MHLNEKKIWITFLFPFYDKIKIYKWFVICGDEFLLSNLKSATLMIAIAVNKGGYCGVNWKDF